MLKHFEVGGVYIRIAEDLDVEPHYCLYVKRDSLVDSVYVYNSTPLLCVGFQQGFGPEAVMLTRDTYGVTVEISTDDSENMAKWLTRIL